MVVGLPELGRRIVPATSGIIYEALEAHLHEPAHAACGGRDDPDRYEHDPPPRQ